MPVSMTSIHTMNSLTRVATCPQVERITIGIITTVSVTIRSDRPSTPNVRCTIGPLSGSANQARVETNCCAAVRGSKRA